MPPTHILIVDDDENSLKVMGRMLDSEGATYVAVADPTDVEGAIEHSAPLDVVFLDLEMPKMNGFELLERLTAILGPEVPIVACTVHVNEIDTAHQLGFHSFVSKPINMTRFPDQLRRILDGERVWEA